MGKNKNKKKQNGVDGDEPTEMTARPKASEELFDDPELSDQAKNLIEKSHVVDRKGDTPQDNSVRVDEPADPYQPPAFIDVNNNVGKNSFNALEKAPTRTAINDEAIEELQEVNEKKNPQQVDNNADKPTMCQMF